MSSMRYEGCTPYPGSTNQHGELEGAGHFSHLEKPEAVARALRRFLG